MAVEVESGSQIEEVLRVLRRRSWWIWIPAVLAVALGAAFAVIVPKKYVVQTTVLVRNTLAAAGSTADGVEEAKNAPAQIKAGERIIQVLEALQWMDWKMLSRTDQEPYIKKISSNLGVALQSGAKDNQQIVKITYSDMDPKRAEEFLLKASEIWQRDVLERERNTETQAWNNLLQDKAENEEKRREIGTKLKELRDKNGLDASPQATRGFLVSASDPVYLQNQADKVELDTLETEISTLESKIKNDKNRYARMEPSEKRSLQESGGVSNQEAISKLRADIRAERDKQARYKKDHSTYRLIEITVQGLESEIQQLETGEADPVLQEQDVPNVARQKLQEEIEEAEGRLASMGERLDKLRAKVREGETRMSELAEVYRQVDEYESEKTHLDEYIQTVIVQIGERKHAHDLVMKANPFDILDRPMRPGRPTEPDPILIVLFSVFAGLGLGLGLALLMEYSKNCFRSVHDISRVMVVPVLGVINTIATRRDRLRVRMTHAAVGGATFVFVSTLAFVTWAWSSKPEMLSNHVREAIEDLRENFK